MEGQYNSTSIFSMCPDVTIDMALPAFHPCEPSQGGSVEWKLGASQFGFKPAQEALQYTVDRSNVGGAGAARATMSMARSAIDSGNSGFVPIGLSQGGVVPKAYTLFSSFLYIPYLVIPPAL